MSLVLSLAGERRCTARESRILTKYTPVWFVQFASGHPQENANSWCAFLEWLCWDFMNVPYPLFAQHKVVAAMLDPWHFSADARRSKRMFEDLADRVKLIGMLKRMRTERILTVTDSPYVNVTYGDTLKNMPDNYNELILDAIDTTFGTKVTKISSREVVHDPEIQQLWDGRACWVTSPSILITTRRWSNTVKGRGTRGETTGASRIF